MSSNIHVVYENQIDKLLILRGILNYLGQTDNDYFNGKSATKLKRSL